MKVAFGLFGEYSDVWKCNEYGEADIFMVAKQFSEDLKQAKAYSVVKNMPELVLSAHEGQKPHVIKQILHQECNRLITQSGEMYDMVVYAQFRTLIFNFPTTPGTYDYSVDGLNQLEIVSDKCVKQGNVPIPLEKLTLDQRHQIFTSMYKGRVVDYANKGKISGENVFCIPSVIAVSEKPFNYETCGARSVFTRTERFEQTVAQVKSLQRIPNSKVYLLEGSHLYFSEMKELAKYCTVVLFNADPTGYTYANINPNKSIYEIYVMREIIAGAEFQRIFKFGGRYSLGDCFDMERFKNPDKVVIKIIRADRTFTQRPIVDCVIYSIPKCLQKDMYEVYTFMVNKLETHSHLATEGMLHDALAGKMSNIDICNVDGRDGVYGTDRVG